MCVVRDEPRCAGGRCLFPQPKSAAKGIGVIARATKRRQRFELLDVASPEHRVVGLERRNEASHDVGNVTTPFLPRAPCPPNPPQPLYPPAFWSVIKRQPSLAERWISL